MGKLGWIVGLFTEGVYFTMELYTLGYNIYPLPSSLDGEYYVIIQQHIFKSHSQASVFSHRFTQIFEQNVIGTYVKTPMPDYVKKKIATYYDAK